MTDCFYYKSSHEDVKILWLAFFRVCSWQYTDISAKYLQ